MSVIPQPEPEREPESPYTPISKTGIIFRIAKAGEHPKFGEVHIILETYEQPCPVHGLSKTAGLRVVSNTEKVLFPVKPRYGLKGVELLLNPGKDGWCRAFSLVEICERVPNQIGVLLGRGILEGIRRLLSK
jgi:hypothetical protein